MEITAGDGHVMSAYRADPPAAASGAVIVLQEIFGVNGNIRAVTDAFAALGFLAIAPCLFDRAKKDVELGYDAAGLSEGLELVKQIDLDTALGDLQATVAAVGDAGKVAVVGYDWGAYIAYHAANRVRGLACAVGYYGCGIAEDYGVKRRIPTLLHFGLEDAYIPGKSVEIFQRGRPDVTVYTYPAGHGFGCAEQPTYDEASAGLAWERTQTMIRHCVQGPPTVTLKNAGAYAAAKTDKKKKPVLEDLEPPM